MNVQTQEKRIETFAEWLERMKPKKGVITKEIWDVPLPSHNGYMRNKNIDYSLLSGLLLMSNFDGLQNKFEGNRYMYKNNFNNEEMKALCGISKATLHRSLSSLKRALPKEDAEKALLSVENTQNGAVYKINFATEGKYFITIPSDTLHYLIKTTNKDIIKLYVFFKVQLANGSKQIQREFIADSIGLNKDSLRQLDNISIMTNSLVAHGLLTKSSRVEFFWDEVNQREIPKTLITYGLTTHEEWLEYYNELTKRKQNKK